MNRSCCTTFKLLSVIVLLSWFLQIPGLRQEVLSASSYDIRGFYLGATPQDINVNVEDDTAVTEKYFETEADDVLLYFVKVEGTFRLYRIVQELDVNPENIKAVLDSLKSRYGTPDRQQIKTSSFRPSNRSSYITNVKNRAIWNVSETQEFIADIESKRVVYELIDNDPENLSSAGRAGGTGEEGFGSGEWESDF